MISYEFPNKGVPRSGKGGLVDPPWDKVLNSTIFLEGIPYKINTLTMADSRLANLRATIAAKMLCQKCDLIS